MKATYIKRLIISFLCLLTFACAQPVENPNIEDSKQQPVIEKATTNLKTGARTIYQQVSNIVQLSCQHNNQCKTIGVGVSPCGGYGKHFVYSTESTNVLKLSKLVEEFNNQQKLNNKKNELVGNCRFISPPKTVCVQQQCLAVNDAAM